MNRVLLAARASAWAVPVLIAVAGCASQHRPKLPQTRLVRIELPEEPPEESGSGDDVKALKVFVDGATPGSEVTVRMQVSGRRKEFVGFTGNEPVLVHAVPDANTGIVVHLHELGLDFRGLAEPSAASWWKANLRQIAHLTGKVIWRDLNTADSEFAVGLGDWKYEGTGREEDRDWGVHEIRFSLHSELFGWREIHSHDLGGVRSDRDHEIRDLLGGSSAVGGERFHLRAVVHERKKTGRPLTRETEYVCSPCRPHTVEPGSSDHSLR